MLTEETKKKFERILSLNTHESIVLQQLLEKGSTTVRDLLPFMNYPCGPIRDLQSVFGIALVYDWETKEKPSFQLTVKNARKKLNIRDTDSQRFKECLKLTKFTTATATNL